MHPTSLRSRAIRFWLSPFTRPDWGRGKAMTRDPLATGDLLTFFSEAITVAAGDQLQGSRCLLCGQAAGDGVVRVVAVVHCRPAQSRPRAITSRAYLVHEEHFPLVDGEAHHAAHVLENPGCRCAVHA